MNAFSKWALFVVVAGVGATLDPRMAWLVLERMG